jgi:hypothetical protein
MVNNCTLTAWTTSSQITHAVAEAPEGPYSYKAAAFGTFHHK